MPALPDHVALPIVGERALLELVARWISPSVAEHVRGELAVRGSARRGRTSVTTPGSA